LRATLDDANKWHQNGTEPLVISWRCFAGFLYMYSIGPYLCKILWWDCFKGELAWCALQHDFSYKCWFLTCSMSALHSHTVSLTQSFSA